MQTQSFYRILFFIGFFCMAAIARAGDGGGVVARAILDGSKNQVHKDSTITVEDSAFFNAAAIGVDTGYQVQNVITLKINEASNVFMRTAFEVKVKLLISYSNGTDTASIIKDFTVTYDTGNVYNARNNFVFYGGRKVTVKVLEVDSNNASWNVSSVLMIENQLTAKPKYVFSCSNTVSNITVSPSAISNADELPVSWTAIRGADQYDLEWTYIDESAAGRYKKGDGSFDPALVFYHNATRVSTTSNTYNIPLMYDNNGRLFIRVRPVQNGKANSVLAAIWSSDASSPVMGQYAFTGHERPLNWQSNISFAEEGKRKVVTQYFDGSMRNRQTVTKDNTNNKTIVAETFYDYQGRPAIQVMPAPSFQNVIQYTAGFNRSINNPEYYKSDFDSLVSPDMYCDAHGKEMVDSSGASLYYSANNPNKTIGMNQFIPDAEKYPFTELEYTPDNTGRISRQGGVGKDFQLGSGHETKYYYGSPDQGELDALFGTDVGDHSHYSKTMVKDANGQFSFSYVDMHGRTIATGLAGKAPTSLAPLASYDSIDVTENLVDSGSRFLENWSMVNQKSLQVSAAGNFAFNYKLDPASLIEKNCDNLGAQNICYTCLYDLQITITDNCNNQSLPGKKAYEKVLRNFSLGAITPSCTPEAMTFSFDLSLQPGTYQITKRLTLSRDGLNYYRDSIYMPNNTCRSLQDFITEQRSIIAETSQDCEPDCAKCRTSVGTPEQFKTNFITQAHIPADEVESYTSQINAAYQNAIEACNALCGDSASADNDIRKAMLQDMTPPYGQYADTTEARRKYKFSIFWVDPKDSLSFIPVFQLDQISYPDATGQPDKVYNANSDMMVEPNTLSRTEFTQSFRTAWAEALLPYHPEYCKLKELEKLRPSNLWDRKMEAVDNYKDAKAAGYLNPTNITTDFYNYGVNTSNIDPFVVIHSELKTKLEEKLTKYVTLNNGKTVNIWALANIVTKCDDGNPQCVNHYNLNKSFNFDTTWCDGDLDLAWISFRNLYLQAKQVFVNDLVNKPTNCTPASPVYTVMPKREELIEAGFQPQFYETLKTVLTEQKLDYANDPDKVSQAKAEAQNQLNAQYDKNVDVLAAQWYNQLAPCYVNNGNDLRDIIIPLLKQLCRKACDPDHLFGASSLPNGAVLEGTSYHNFREIIDGYNSTHGIASDSLACSADNITVPAPYDKQPIYYNKPVYDKPAACECEILNEQYIQYSNIKNQGGKDANFAAYLKRTQGVTMSNSDLQTLLSLCNNTEIPGDGGYNCAHLAEPIYLPPALQCNSKEVCTNCTVVKDLYQSFKQQYPNDTPRIADTDDTVQVRRNLIFQNYMNNHLGYAKQTWEYLQFLKTCEDSSANIRTISYCTDERIGNLYFTESNEPGKLQDIQPTPDGGYIMAGSVNGISKNGILVKTDSLGRMQWAKHYGGSGSDTLLRVRRTTDNGYIAIGTTHSGRHSSGAVWILKTDANGNATWTKTIGFSTPFGEHGYDIIQTSDGGYAALGVYNQHAGHGEFLLSRLQSNGNISWVRRFGTSRLQNNSTACIPGLTDSINYNGAPSYGLLEQEDTLLVSGAAYDPNLGDRYFGVIHKVNKNNGNLMRSWHYADGADTTRSCWFRDIYATENGYMVMVNSAQQLGTVNAQVGVMNLTKTGNVVSYKRFNIPAGSNRMVTSSVFPVSGGGYMVAQTGNNSTHIIWQRVDASGNLVWANQTNLAGTQTVGRIAQNNNGRFTMAGDNNQQMLMLVLNPGTTCYDQEMDLGATDETASRIPWAIGVDESVSPMYTDTTLTGYALVLRDSTLVCSGGGHCYEEYDGPRLCGRSEPVLPPLVITYEGACADSTSFAVSKGTELYKAYTDSLSAAFERNYTEKCLAAYRYESFTVTYTKREYHYTLYYYDQAGNLIRTVPPAGVHVVDTMQVRLARKAGTKLVPEHTMYTDYRYNTLNKVVAQHTPDGGTTEFWYDRLGRLSISQNAKQEDSSKYSYTKYDIIGRITEVGQLTSSTGMADATSRDQGSLNTWLSNAASTAEQITRTGYDIEFTPISDALKAKNLRNRVAWAALFDKAADLDNIAYTTGSFYSYDILGNIDTLVHVYRKGLMWNKDNGIKKIAYDFDLVSGKVNLVSYQPGQKDAFYHKYVYDAENRITNVLISADSINWDNDAFYQYYDHGPLARAVIGEQQVQGINYTYNLQGWMKSINPDVQTPGFTLKPDGSYGSVVGKPAYQISLNYFDGDYKAISGATPWSGSALNGNYRPLYNGNISNMAVNVEALNNPLLYNYQYDQLNRMVAMDAWKRNNNNWSSLTHTDDYQERVSYDPNGNILGYKRNGTTAGGKQLEMDDLTYNYISGTNRLGHVHDNVSATNYTEDIDAQSAGNYDYDALGNLIKDNAEGVARISWTVYGKIRQIVKNDSTKIIYSYDAAGNRISKLVIPASGGQGVTTWYTRDAQGKVMSVYEDGKASLNGGRLTQTELHLYGSSRLGLLRRSLMVEDSISTTPDPYKIAMPVLGAGDSIPFARGNKFFELSNHLSNVLVTVNDKKLGVSSNNSTVDYFSPQVVSAQDYYPFGMLQPGRSYNAGVYRYGFNGKENDNEVKGEGNLQDFDSRFYDGRLGRFLSNDPKEKQYVGYSPMSAFNNNPVIFVDPTGQGGELGNFRKIDNGGVLETHADLTFRIFLVAGKDGASVENIRKFMQVAHIAEGSPIEVNDNYKGILYSTNNGQRTEIFTHVKVELHVISAEEAKGLIENETNIANNYVQVVGGTSAAFQDMNIFGSNQGIISLSSLADDMGRGFTLLTHYAWHSADARYKYKNKLQSPDYEMGSHNISPEMFPDDRNAENSIMVGGFMRKNASLTQTDFNALALSDPAQQRAMDKHIHLPNIGPIYNKDGSYKEKRFGAGLLKVQYTYEEYKDLYFNHTESIIEKMKKQVEKTNQ